MLGLRRPLACVLGAALLFGSTDVLAQSNGRASTGNTLPPALARVLEHPSLQGARVGIVARALPTGEFLVRHNADELFAPASVAKLFAVAAALWKLGPHFVWKTPLAFSGSRFKGTIEGELWVLGRGAPDLVEEQLFLAAVALRDLGLARISGDLIVDDRYFDDEIYGKGWPGGGQRREAYHAAVRGLMANFAARREGREWRAVDDPTLHFGERLRHFMEMTGISIDGEIRRPNAAEEEAFPSDGLIGPNTGSASLSDGLTHLHTIRSEPLSRLVMDINKFSNNVMAESLLKTLGAYEYGSPGTATKGLAVVARFLEETLDMPLNSYILVDGSGLSRLDRFSPEQVVRLLKHAHTDFHFGPELVASLKIGGLDGWNPAPFKQPPLIGELRIKSGHIRGVNTLSGYLHTSSGRVVAFTTMINEHRSGQWEIDQRMAELTNALISGF